MMKKSRKALVAGQILKEGWFPLAAAVVWTLWSVPYADWSFTKLLGVATPTFAVVGYLSAQLFRILRQTEVSTSLSKIETRVGVVLDQIEKQADKLAYVSSALVIQTFDECIVAVREANEEVADINRRLRHQEGIDESVFRLNRGNPLYEARSQLAMLLGYASHVVNIGEQSNLQGRFDRCAHYVEELAGHVNVLLSLLQEKQIPNWKTERTVGLVKKIVEQLERFETAVLPHSKYKTAGYKNGQELKALMQSQIEKLRKHTM